MASTDIKSQGCLVQSTFAQHLEQTLGWEQTQAVVETFVLDRVYQTLPEPPYTPDDKAQVARLVYRHIWQQSVEHRSSRKSTT